MLIYKIIDAPIWSALQANTDCPGSADDHRDGYVHFSTAEQLASTFEKYFAERWHSGEPLYLLSCDSSQLPPSQLRFEASRGGALFPHWYGLLTLGMARECVQIDPQRVLHWQGAQCGA